MNRESFLLSSYRPPTTYPVTLLPDEAEAWLNAYFCLWHPAALHGRCRPPVLASVYDHDRPQEGFLYAVPASPHHFQPDDWDTRVREAGAIAFATSANLPDSLENLLAPLRTSGIAETLTNVDPAIVRAFSGLGYAYLLIESLFDAMDHEHLLDADAFWADVSSAVLAVQENRDSLVYLRSAADKLRMARESLNSNSMKLVDIAFRSSSNLNSPWPGSLAAGKPISVIATGQTLEELARNHPERWNELRSQPALADICCGSYRDREDAMFPVESQWWNLARARQTVRNLTGADTPTYARLRSAQHPQLPSWLQLAGFRHAIAVSFDGALSPARNAAVINWPAPDGNAMDSFSREPIPAHDPATFFNLVYHLHQSYTQDSAPVLAFRHDGETPAAGYDQLLAATELGDLVGEWVSVSGFLADQHYGDYLGTTTADDYFNDYLDERVEKLKRPDPVSGFAAHARGRRRLDGIWTLASLFHTLSPFSDADRDQLQKLEQLEDDLEITGADWSGSPQRTDLSASESYWAGRLAERIQARSPDHQPGFLVFNPCAYTRRVALELTGFGGPIPMAEHIKAAEFSDGLARLVVEVPSLGYAWIPRGGNAPPPKPKLKTAEGTTVRNEFLEAELDPQTGALRAVRDMRTRVNRLGMQLVFNPGSRMIASSITATHNGTALGELTCEGEIQDDQNQLLAKFRQRFRLWVGRPALEIRLEILPVTPPAGYAWHAYYGARFATRDERAALFRGVNGSNFQTSATRPCSPDYLEFRLGSERSFIFTGGLPFLNKHGSRMVDAVLVPPGETETTLDLLVAFDREYPMQTAAGWIAPAPVVSTGKGPPPVGATGWLGHLDLPSLHWTSLRPCPPGDGMSRAVVARFTETAGYAGNADLQFARDPNRAFMVTNELTPGNELTLSEGKIPLEFSADQTFCVKAEWQ